MVWAQTCVLVANGPSLNKIRWDWQDNFNVIMGMNKIFLNLFRPDIYSMVRGGVQAERLRMTSDIRQKIREKAKQEGFDAVGFTSSETNPRDVAAISKFLLKGCHGDMAWMAREFPDCGNPRGNPQALMPDARSVIVLGTNYGPGIDL